MAAQVLSDGAFVVPVLLLAVLTVALGPQTPLEAVPSFAVVTSAGTTRRFFGPGLPAVYDFQVPPIPTLIQRYMADGQTLEFIDAGELEHAAQQHSAAQMLGRHKLVVLPEVAELSNMAGAALLAFARSGGSVIAVGSALAHAAGGKPATNGFATPLGRALKLRRASDGPETAMIISRNVSVSSNPEWWRLLNPFDSASRQQLDGGAVGSGLTIHAVELLNVESGGALLLATATLANGKILPLLTATRVGQRGWLVYCATTADAQLVQQAANFVFSATGVADPYNVNPRSPMGVKVTGGNEASTALLSFAAPANPHLSLEGRFRVTLVEVAVNSTFCVTFLDRWWGDSSPSHTITNTSNPSDFNSVIAQVSYGGTVACATISPGRPTTFAQQPPWFELRTTANGALTDFCKSPASRLAEECELNGRCSASGDCVCVSGWIGTTC